MAERIVALVAIGLLACSCGESTSSNVPGPKATTVLPSGNVTAPLAHRASSGEPGWVYPRIELEGKLQEIFAVSDCQFISSLTCPILYNGKAPLPSEVFFVGYDAVGKPEGKKMRLIYPRLDPGERGMATFRLQSSNPDKIVMTAAWDGPWRNPY